MLKRLYLNLEIIGYSRAIGAMAVQPGVTADHMVGLYTAREDVKKRLVELKASKSETSVDVASTAKA
jgi:hypothetical protein